MPSQYVLSGGVLVPVPVNYILGSVTEPATVPSATATEVVLAQFPLKGSTLGPNGGFRVWWEWSFTGSVNTKTMRLYLGSQNVALATSAGSVSTSTAANVRTTNVFHVFNVGRENAQQLMGPNGLLGVANSSAATLAENTANDLFISIAGTKIAGETLTLRAAYVELLIPYRS